MKTTELLTVSQIAEQLGMNPTTVRHHLRAGRLPGSKTSNIWHMSTSDLESWISARQGKRSQFVSARGLLRKYPSYLSGEQVGDETVKLTAPTSQSKRKARPDLEMAARNLNRFYREGTLTTRIAQLENGVAERSAVELDEYLVEQDVAQEILGSALALKAIAGQINVVIHAAGILLSLPYLLEDDEVIDYVSLGAGNTGKPFDLDTDRRVAEFKFINWQGGSESIRQNQLFKDLFYLAEYVGDKQRCLYVLGKEHPLRFLRGNRAMGSVLSKNATLKDAFMKKYSDLKAVSDYYSIVADRVELIDLTEKVPFLSAL